MCVHCQVDCAADGLQILREANALLKSGGQAYFSYCGNNPYNGTLVTQRDYGKQLKALSQEGIDVEVFRAVFRFYSDPTNRIYYNIVTFKKR
jgi:gamma-glutamyltranspeptidase